MFVFRAKTSKYLHPLVVLEILARNDKLKVADIKDYIVNWLKEQNELVIFDRKFSRLIVRLDQAERRKNR